MAYIDFAFVHALAPRLPLSATTVPSQTDVTNWIDQVEAVVNAMLKTIGYQTPITGPASLVIVKDIVAHGVLARWLRALQYGVGDVNAPGAQVAQEFYDTQLKKLADPKDPYELPDETRTGEKVEKNVLPHVESNTFGDSGPGEPMDWLDDEPRRSIYEKF